MNSADESSEHQCAIEVLLVDDEPALLVAAASVFRKRYPDISCDTCANGHEALEKLHHTSYDAIVADYDMPRMNGIALLKEVRSRFGDIPFIILTGRGNEEVAIEALNSGADFYLQKGSDLNTGFTDLAHKIRQATRRRYAEKALRESEDTKAIVLESVTENVVFQDPGCRIIWVNKAAADSVHMSPENLVGRYCYELWQQREEPCEGCPAIQSIETGVTQNARRRSPDGRIWKVRSDPVRNDEGEIIGAVKTALEITEQEHAARMIRWLAQFPQEDPNPVLRARHDGHLLYANDASASLRSAWSVEVGERLPTSLLPLIRVVLKEEEPLRTEVNVGDRTYLLTLSPSRSDNFVNIYGLNITGRKKAEKKLAESEKRLRMALQAAHMYVFEINPVIDEAKLDPAFIKALGYTPEEMGTSSVDFDHFIHPDDLQGVHSGRKNCLKGISGQYQEKYRIRCRDGTWKWIYALGDVVERDKNGNPRGILGIHVDITELQEAKGALREANKKLHLIEQITRHDILNKVNGITGFLSLLREDMPADPALATYIDYIEMSMDAIRTHVRFAEDYYRLGEHPAEWQNVAMSIKRAADCMSLDGIRLEVRTDHLEFFADPMLEKALNNILENSVRYGEHVTTIEVGSREENGSCILVISDDGVGISGGMKEDIFEKGVGRNSGIGLFITKEILEITGITISETGEEGRGARFEITVPQGKWRIAQDYG